MVVPQGNITPVQYEILQVIWDGDDEGSTVGEIWRAISKLRSVGRTTVLNLVDRLEKRSWLVRQRVQGVYRYCATLDREKTTHALASGFVDDFFGGKASDLVMSLLGNKSITKDEVERLRKLIDKTSQEDE
ncbi:MAG: BlaI/MecI/CopY family transcriptional regulator [Phycisphaeraceae bacterium]|nr:BlaI/MecI/CopY family transcriptional regulator [Phycisphaeraceae bacterium]